MYLPTTPLSSPPSFFNIEFYYRSERHRIKAGTDAPFDAVLRSIKERLGAEVALKVTYKDPADGDVCVLGPDRSFFEVVTAGYKIEVKRVGPERKLVRSRSKRSKAIIPASLKGGWMDYVSHTWRCKRNIKNHAFFISYRDSTESLLARALAPSLERAVLHDGEKSHVFLDKDCLSLGEEYYTNFISGLFHSDVIILLCSERAMERMKEADIHQDNMLLEWELALDVMTTHKRPVLPVFLSEVTEVVLPGATRKSEVKKTFKGFSVNNFPAAKHCHALSPKKYTIREVVMEIYKLQGLQADQDDNEKIIVSARELMNRKRLSVPPSSLSGFSGSGSYISWSSEDHFEGSQVALMTQEESANLMAWLKPLHEQMEAERQRILQVLAPGTRQWVLPYLDQMIGSKRILQIYGAAGTGKSSMMAVVANELKARSLLGGIYFANCDEQPCGNVRDLIKTMAFGLARLSGYVAIKLLEMREADVEEDHEILETLTSSELFAALITRPLEQAFQEGALVDSVHITLILDTADEGDLDAFRDFIEPFYNPDSGLPAQIRLLLTSRLDSDDSNVSVSNLRRAMKDVSEIVHIDRHNQNYDNDAVAFAKHFLELHFAKADVIETGSQLLLKKSKGVFVWLVVACKMLAADKADSITLAMINALPDSSLAALYLEAFSRIFVDFNDQAVLRGVLGAIATAQAPMTAVKLEEKLNGFGPGEVRRAIRKLIGMLDLNPNTQSLRLFHKTVAEFLCDPTACTDRRFYVGNGDGSNAEAVLDRATTTPIPFASVLGLAARTATTTTSNYFSSSSLESAAGASLSSANLERGASVKSNGTSMLYVPRLHSRSASRSGGSSSPAPSAASSLHVHSAHQHPLISATYFATQRPEPAGAPEFHCNVCKKGILPGQKLFSCSVCEYDECSGCAETSRSVRAGEVLAEEGFEPATSFLRSSIQSVSGLLNVDLEWQDLHVVESITAYECRFYRARAASCGAFVGDLLAVIPPTTVIYFHFRRDAPNHIPILIRVLVRAGESALLEAYARRHSLTLKEANRVKAVRTAHLWRWGFGIVLAWMPEVKSFAVDFLGPDDYSWFAGTPSHFTERRGKIPPLTPPFRHYLARNKLLSITNFPNSVFFVLRLGRIRSNPAFKRSNARRRAAVRTEAPLLADRQNILVAADGPEVPQSNGGPADRAALPGRNNKLVGVARV
ncbi:hypothetical protein DFJ73DRAFT_851612 [Zopfochytrium polystomum]|nr:hypothetical protein DFJ73DRAFT_851612 [Zopfochytrium polystomum]